MDAEGQRPSPTPRRLLALEAAALLVFVRLAFVGIRVAATRRLLGAYGRRGSRPDDPSLVRVIGRVVESVARRLPGTSCLAAAVTADAMLRRRGLASTLHLGVRPPEAGTPLDAHAWVESAGAIVIGDRADLDQYTMLAKRV